MSAWLRLAQQITASVAIVGGAAMVLWGEVERGSHLVVFGLVLQIDARLQRMSEVE